MATSLSYEIVSMWVASSLKLEATLFHCLRLTAHLTFPFLTADAEVKTGYDTEHATIN